MSGAPKVLHLEDQEDIVTFLEKTIEEVQAGRLQAFTLRVKLKDGTVQDLALGFDTDEERDAALARMLRALGDLQ